MSQPVAFPLIDNIVDLFGEPAKNRSCCGN
jgi:hypothetical protein